MTIDTKFIIFKINETQSLIIKNLCADGDHLYRYDPIEIIFKDKNTTFIISEHDHLMPSTEDLFYNLKDAIKNKLVLLKSIKADLGYLWNQDLNYRNIVPPEKRKNEKRWKGTRYLMWESNEFDTWMFSQNNSIYLEITPAYPWQFSEPEKSEKFIPFDEWIKNYKPLALIEIDKTTAQQWLEQTKLLMQEIEKSDEKYLHTPQDEIEE